MEDNRLKCLNVGSGTDYKPSSDTEHWTNIDPESKVRPDLVTRVEELDGFFPENSFDLVHFVHVWEHCEDLILPMEQIWHVLKPGGKLIVVCPFYTSENAYADPTHKHVITRITFGFFSYPVCEGNAKAGTRMSQLFPRCDFDIKRVIARPNMDKETFKDDTFAMKHYFNVIEEIQAEMVAVKPIRMFDIRQYQKRGAEVTSG